MNSNILGNLSNSNILDVRGKNKNGRDNTKWAGNSYFHCGPQAEKVIRST